MYRMQYQLKPPILPKGPPPVGRGLICHGIQTLTCMFVTLYISTMLQTCSELGCDIGLGCDKKHVIWSKRHKV